MAIAGGATTAYRCQVNDGQLTVTQTTMLRSLCASTSAALALLASGERVTVAGSDMAELRRMLDEQGVRV